MSTELRRGELSDACGWACAIELTGTVVAPSAKSAASVPSTKSRADSSSSRADSLWCTRNAHNVLLAPLCGGRGRQGRGALTVLLRFPYVCDAGISMQRFSRPFFWSMGRWGGSLAAKARWPWRMGPGAALVYPSTFASRPDGALAVSLYSCIKTIGW